MLDFPRHFAREMLNLHPMAQHEKRDYLPEAASDPHLPAPAPDRAKNASQPELHDLRAQEGCVSADFFDLKRMGLIPESFIPCAPKQ